MKGRRALSAGVALLVALSVATAGFAGTAAAAETYAIVQGEQCIEVAPFGQGSQTVEAFYDYRWHGSHDSPNNKYSSYGTTDLQENQNSLLFVYEGSNGDSLVMLHDKLDTASPFTEGPGGGAITFDFSGLPQDGDWAVIDDNYPNRDDQYTLSGTEATIDWMWAAHRTDGAAFRGIDADSYEAITVNPAFDDQSWAIQQRDPPWNEEESSYAPMDQWKVVSADGNTMNLDKTQSVSVRKGNCDTTPPTAALTGPSSVEIGETASFDASNSTDDRGIAEYRWDFDGDGTIDANTTTPTATTTYESAGTYDASVTVVDTSDNAATASTTVAVADDTPPNATISAPGQVRAAETFTADGSGSTDNGRIVSYNWSFDGTTKTGETVTHRFDEPGSHAVSLTVTDAAGNEDTANTTVTAVHEGELHLSDASGAPGHTVSVTLSGEAADVAGYQANLTYDPDDVTVTSVAGADFDDPIANWNNSEGWLFMTQSAATGTDNPALATVTLRIEDGASAATAVSFVEADSKLTDERGESIDVVSYDGATITVTGGACEAGDANGDGQVTPLDATLVLRAWAGHVSEDDITGCADINGDGSVNSLDATLILQAYVS